VQGETLDADKFTRFISLPATILAVLDPDLARMPPGETTPVTEQRRFEVS
jgi:hypothetical protein